MGNEAKELTLEELSERWDWLFWQDGVEKLVVVEQFNKSVSHSYEVTGLSMEFEHEYVMCGDLDDSLSLNVSILLMFLRQSIKSVFLLPIGNDLYQERIEFNDGVVLIEKAC